MKSLGLPETFDLVSKSKPILIDVYRRGDFVGNPLDKTRAYVPEGKENDIPRSFASAIPEQTKWIYREDAFIEKRLKQRKHRVLYLLQHPSSVKLPIYVISKAGKLRRKVSEIKDLLNTLRKNKVEIEGIIILLHKDLLTKTKDIIWPIENVLVSTYS